MPVNDRHDLIQIPTVPDNTDQPPRFGDAAGVVKDAFVLEVRKMLTNTFNQMRLGELPRIEKYQFSGSPTTDPLETATSIIRNFADIPENLPTVAVMTTSFKPVKLSLSSKSVDLVVLPARVISNSGGPFTLADHDTLIIDTMPSGKPSDGYVRSTFTFNTEMFDDITNATIDDVIEVINFQALYANAFKYVSGSTTALAINAGNRGKQFPNYINIVGGTAVAKLGFTVSQNNANYGAGKIAYMRYYNASDMTVDLHIIAESENVRTELTDLIYTFFTYTMSDRMWQFYGRSMYDESIQDEFYQIIIMDKDIRVAGESEIARPNDPKHKMYINKISMPVQAIQYMDRTITDRHNNPLKPVAGVTLVDGIDFLPTPN